MHKLFCEPFPGSSWKAPPQFPYGDTVAYQWLEGVYYLAAWDHYLQKLHATDEKGVEELLNPTSTSKHINLQQGQVCHRAVDGYWELFAVSAFMIRGNVFQSDEIQF